MYIGTMAVSSCMISSCFTYGFILAVFFSFTGADVTVIQGKIQDPAITRFSIAGRRIQLICDPDEVRISNSTKLKWSFIGKNNENVPDVSSVCTGHRTKKEIENDNGTSSKPLLTDCVVKLSGNSSLTLDINNITGQEFGDYVCNAGNRTLTIHLQEIVHLYRKNEKGKMLISETVNVGDPLFIYCNHTGYYPEKHVVSWWRDGENITEELKDGTGNFENFTAQILNGQLDYLTFEGIALLEHRGNYTCQVDLKVNSKEEGRLYPVEFSYFLRVKEGTEWQFPVYILLGQCALIALFTLIVNYRENKKEESDYPIEDSEDEDDVPPAKSNGTQNNNSHGK